MEFKCNGKRFIVKQKRKLKLYQSSPYPCPYLSEKTAANIFGDSTDFPNQSVYDKLIRYGFRRNGKIYYRPSCPACIECQSIRVVINDFIISRSQRRGKKKNSDVDFQLYPATYRQEHFNLYHKYQKARHKDCGMDDPDPANYQKFLIHSSINTFLIEMRINGRLVGVSIIDHVSNGLSAVYTFYEPNELTRSLGILAILYEIELCREMECLWLYLGYWIKDSPKMNYKKNFTPCQIFDTQLRQWKSIA